MFSNKLVRNILIKPLYNHFTAGESIKTLQSKIVQLNTQKLYPIADYIKEFSYNKDDIKKSFNEYLNLAAVKELDYIAIKLSTFNFDYDLINSLICYFLATNKKIFIDAEEVLYQNKINDMTNSYIEKHNKNDIHIYKTYQMYRKDGMKTLEDDLSNFTNLGIKLVRGAYLKTDSSTGLLFKTKKETDMSYTSGVDLIFDKLNNSKQIKSFICTHNSYNIEQMIKLYNKELHKDKIYHASLYGFIKDDTQKIIQSEIKTYKYLPYGDIEDAVPYLTRRIYENPKILRYCL